MYGWTMSKLADVLPRTPWPDCLHSCPPWCVCVWVCVCVRVRFFVEGHTPSPSNRPHSSALRPVKHSWDISPPPLSLPPAPDSHPLLPLRAPQTPAGGFDSGGVEQQGEHFHFYLLRRLRDPPHPPSSCRTASHQHKRVCHVPSSLCMLQMQSNWYRHDRGGEGAHVSMSDPRRLIFFFPSSFCCFWVCRFSKSDSLCFLHWLSPNARVCPAQ